MKGKRTLNPMKSLWAIKCIGLFCFLIGGAMLHSGCKDDEVQTPQTEQPVLETAVENMNKNVNSLQQLIEIQQEGTTVVSSLKLINGYRFELSNGKTLNVITEINTKAEGEKESYSPQLGIKEREGIYRWTIDGGWLYINGEYADASGDNRITPEVGVSEDGYWQITCGENVIRLTQKAEYGKFNSIFKEVDTSDLSHVVFLFNDRTPSIILQVNDAAEEEQPPLTGSIRRPVSSEQPMWLVHIDSWVYPDPQKIIDLIPADIRPYVVFNLSLSISRNSSDTQWNRVEYGYETAKSWLRVCAENRVWAMIQPSSGGYSHFPDYTDYSEMENSIYDEFFREYPNFLGFNYCEQFWGFDGNSSLNVTSDIRLAHFANLIKLSHKYGGYLVISCCNPYWGASTNPIAILKRNIDLADACRKYTENMIICEKFTSKHGFFDVESTCLGAYLSGFSGQYGVRADESGWNTQNGDTEYPVSAGAPPVIEHIMLTGQTIFDGPELIWKQCMEEAGTTTVNGYTSRQWRLFPQFINISMDIFRKILDGTIRIMSREEVIDRTKVVIINDVNSGNDRDKYCSPGTLYEGLYLMDGEPFVPAEQNSPLYENTSWFKKTGRYPTIPVVYEYQSNYESRWGDQTTKVNEFNLLFPEVSEGNLYVGRYENGLVTYNPGNYDGKSTSIPLQYNTCEKLELTYDKYTTGVIKEYSDRITIYLTNYDPDNLMKTDVIKVYGCTSKPDWNYVDRGQHVGSRIQESWNNNVLTLAISHNGPLDLTVNCSGNATNRKTDYHTASVSVPASPIEYWGDLQYEAENFEYKGGVKIIKSGVDGDIRGYTALGYLNFGTGPSAAVREEVNVRKDGIYTLQIKYRAPEVSISTVTLYVNGENVVVPEFAKTENRDDVWNINLQTIRLKQGKNTLELRTGNTLHGDFYIDNFVIANR